MIRSAGVGGYVAGESHILLCDRTTKPGAPGVLICTGSHSTAPSTMINDGLDRAIALAKAGFVVMSGDHGQPFPGGYGTYGNDTAITRIGQMRTFLQSSARHISASSGKIHLTGGSGGCAAAINFALRNPAFVASMSLMLPLIDLEDIYNNRTDATVTQAEIDTAYGGHAAYLAAVATHSPKRQDKTPLANIPIRMFYADANDPYISLQSVFDFRDEVNGLGGNVSLVNLGGVGHNAATVDPQDAVAFFKAHP